MVRLETPSLQDAHCDSQVHPSGLAADELASLMDAVYADEAPLTEEELCELAARAEAAPAPVCGVERHGRRYTAYVRKPNGRRVDLGRFESEGSAWDACRKHAAILA